MSPFFSLVVLVACLLSVFAAPANSKAAVPGKRYAGWGTHFDDKRNACPGMKYSFNEPIVAVNSQKFDKSLCGKYVRVNLRGSNTKKVYKIVDICHGCDKNSLDFSKTGLRQLTKTSGMVRIDWEVLKSYKPTSTKVATKTTTKTTTRTTTTKTTKATAKPTSKPSSSKKYSGRGTWFSDTSGSCGQRFSQSDMIVALNQAQMGALYGKGSKCGQKVRVSAKGYPGKYVDAVIRDTCPSKYCSYGALDLSRGVFQRFAPLNKGVLQLEWQFL
ncbi:hypothetical protein BGZ52_007397 [Haplosporangium bisporale]|nr:hypothetical protein BGZ52_007397 [Haplosporangium bisporale]KAF9212604.1 hypothetical protein BGZ59_006546 [Podila verticillata]KAI9234870.1 MAG: RlpA-like double-psi beta-barrel-protein domain-containing protein-containing protein [Podila humilis]KFH71519.1 hypothetical protein MVEG_01818 [Podila verticillata NRRL 6337]